MSVAVTEAMTSEGAAAPAVRYRVVLADAISATGLLPLAEDARFEIVARTGLKGEALAEALADADAVIVRSATRITREALRLATRLRVIGRAGVGVDNIDVEAATEKGIAVLNAPAGNTISAAELTMALLLSLVRRIPGADRSMKAGEWDRKSFSGIELHGRTLGLLGAGRIGTAVADRARGFGMRVVAHDPYLDRARAAAHEIELTTLDDVIAQADVLSVHVPLTEQTRGIIGDEQFRRMKRGVRVLNAARGGVIDEAALARALESGHVAGAGIDVYESEPLPADHPLRRAPNTVLTPHLGASTREAQENVALEIADAVRAALLENDYTRAVNAPAIGGEAMRRLRPLLDLAERLGRLACGLAEGPLQKIEIRYSGDAEGAIAPLASATLCGAFRGVVGRGGINFVNAMHVAERRGATVSTTRLPRHAHYAEYVEVEATVDGRSVRVAGALLDGAHPRIVRIGAFHVDIRPRGTLVVVGNRDVPGVIGRVGSLLGSETVNIAEYHQSRLEPGGEALGVISVDGAVSEGMLSRLREVPEIESVGQVQLD
jgi:D-3-phosphoglycerate dehydrogenase